MAALNHMYLLNTQNVASVTEKFNIKFIFD